jgi:hypothetical protein
VFKTGILFGLFVLYTLSCPHAINCQAQEIKNPGEKFLTDFDIRVKQFNEFIDRFNFQSDFKGEKIDPVFKSKVSRTEYLKILFNLKDPRLDREKQTYSANYLKLKNEFINKIITDSIFVNKHSELIIAAAKTKIQYNSNPEEILIYLNQEIIDRRMVKWVISSVSADFLNIMKFDSTYVRFIPPSSNELDFINLKRAMEDKDHLADYARKDYVYDALSVFFFNVHSGNIKIDFITQTEYYIFDIPGWCVKVKDFNRSGSNSGWLIDNIYKTDKDPIQFLNSF